MDKVAKLAAQRYYLIENTPPNNGVNRSTSYYVGVSRDQPCRAVRLAGIRLRGEGKCWRPAGLTAISIVAHVVWGPSGS